MHQTRKAQATLKYGYEIERNKKIRIKDYITMERKQTNYSSDFFKEYTSIICRYNNLRANIYIFL